MVEITQNHLNTRTRVNIPQMLGGIIGLEKKNGSYEATKCRQEIKEKLEGEQRNRGIDHETCR